MEHFWTNFALEIGLFSLLGIVYYFYQKRRILRFEEDRAPLVISYVLNACLSEKGETPQPELDSLIEALDDYMNKKTTDLPIHAMTKFSESEACSTNLRNLIHQSLKELQ